MRKQTSQLKIGKRSGQLPREDMQMTNKYITIPSTSCVLREFQIKTMMTYYFITIKWLMSKTLATPNAGRMWYEKNSYSLLVRIW